MSGFIIGARFGMIRRKITPDLEGELLNNKVAQV